MSEIINSNEIISRMQKESVKILEQVINICEQLEIPYFFTEGSCLGAIRHKDFIPWDDDLDIAIPANYYEKFLIEGAKLLDPKFQIRGAFDLEMHPEHVLCLTKVINKTIEIESELFWFGQHPCVDVFMIYGLPSNVIMREIHFFNIELNKKLYKIANKVIEWDRKRGYVAEKIIKILRNTDKVEMLNKEKLYKRLKTLLYKYDYSTSKYVFAFPSDYTRKEIMRKEIYGIGQKAEFGELTISVPVMAEEYLTNIYGDYMQLPPEEERVSKHRVTAIRINEK